MKRTKVIGAAVCLFLAAIFAVTTVLFTQFEPKIGSIEQGNTIQGLSVTLSCEKARFKPGEEIPLKCSLTNNSRENQSFVTMRDIRQCVEYGISWRAHAELATVNFISFDPPRKPGSSLKQLSSSLIV